MKHSREYRAVELVQGLVREIHASTQHPWSLMEVCGGQTHAFLRHGLDQLLPKEITLLHGPGCPVCVTPVELVDRAIQLAGLEGVILCSFGDMLRVPGSEEDLLAAKARGGDVRAVYSPLDALELARKNPDKEVVFFAVGFETTAPTTALTVETARSEGVKNFSLLVAHVLIPPAMEALLADPESSIDGFLAAGHVCTVTGTQPYHKLAERYSVPITVTGFEPADILTGVLETVKQLEKGTCGVVNAYSRAVRPEGNPHARAMVDRVFRPCDREWRGMGCFPASGLTLREEYAAFDAMSRFTLVRGENTLPTEPGECISALVLQGRAQPLDCTAFAGRCTPEHPLGATMVSSEGACAAYYHHGSWRDATGESSR